MLNLDYSPIKGPEGNIEFLGSLSCEKNPSCSIDVEKIIEDAHNSLKG